MSSNKYYSKRRRRKRRDYTLRTFKPIYVIIPAAIVVVAAVVSLCFLLQKKESITSEKYLASSSTKVSYYVYNEEEKRMIKSSDQLPRGITVTDLHSTVTENELEYNAFLYEDETYYLSSDSASLVEELSQVVSETSVWVRTNATVYDEKDGYKPISLAKKGDQLEILDFDEMEDDGSIHKYQIQFTDATGEEITGWVYGKYMAATEEEALSVNQEVYDTHRNRIYVGLDLYGGLPTTLDWFPVEKPSFENNPLLENASCMYITVSKIKNIDDYIDLALENGVNSMVIDIKGEEGLAYDCQEIKEISPTTYKYSTYTTEDYQKAIQKCKDAGLYCIGRIVTFNDELYALDHPEVCIVSSESMWPSAYSRDCWYFNITLAKAAVELCGFNEIQFDYVRFPESAYSMSASGDADFRNYYDEEKAEAIQDFCYYICDVLHEMEVYVSIDVFGECVGTYVTAYGQYFPALSNVVDAISAMPYTDHYGTSVDTWTDAYSTVYDWAVKCAARQSEIPTPAIARTWVTAYNVPFWNPTVECDADYIAAQAQALVDAGVDGGFITWNSASNFEKYQEIADAWNRTYTKSDSNS